MLNVCKVPCLYPGHFHFVHLSATPHQSQSTFRISHRHSLKNGVLVTMVTFETSKVNRCEIPDVYPVV